MTRRFYLLAGFLSLVLLSLSKPTSAQTTPTTSTLPAYSQVQIASPTAASLGKFVDVPVTYHTGIPQIGVPLYTIKEGNLSLPISLSYHAGGIKVQEPAGWVGTGWALNAGGVITRSVAGAADESGTSLCEKGHFSDYGFSSYLTLYGTDTNNNPAPNGNAFAKGQFDGEPDLFFFNFNGYSGKFFFSDDRTPVIIDGQDLKIEYYYPRESAPSTVSSLGDNNIQGFIITVPTGDKYYFGVTDALPYNSTQHAGDKPVEMSYTNTDGPGVDNNIYSSYYLSKIVAADGVHTIQLAYQRETYGYATVLTFPVEGDIINLQEKGFKLASINIDGVRLAKVTFSTGTVDFQAAATPRSDLSSYAATGLDDYVNTEAKALDNIRINSTDFCKQFSFTYSYFSDNNTPAAFGLHVTTGNGPLSTDKKRLRLESVQEKSCDGTAVINPWQFTYNGTFLPRRLSLAQDHWGFYNGADQNNQRNVFIASYSSGASDDNPTPGSEVVGANRDPQAAAMALGSLTQVTYPTGGTATFDYEPNDVWVSRRVFESRQVFSYCVGSYCGGQSPYDFSLTFSGNFYKFVLDYTRNPNDSYNGSVYFTGPTRGLGVGEKNGLMLHDELVQQPAARTVNCELYADIAAGSGEGGILQIFEYVPQTIEENALVGGLRINTITSRENAQASGIVTSYTYREPNGHSSGTLFSRPRYGQVVRNDDIMQIGYGSPQSSQTANLYPNGCINPETLNGNPNCQTLQLSPAGIVPMATTQGNHIGYSRVSVSQSGNGRTEYQYYCSNDQSLNTATELGKTYSDVCYRTLNRCVCDRSAPSLPAAPLRFEFNRGQLAAEIAYGEQGQLLHMRRYNYLYDSSRLVTPAWIVRNVATALLATKYERRSYWKKQVSVAETSYSNDGKSFTKSQTSYYESAFHHQLTRQTETAPSGEVLETRFQYAPDFSPAACAEMDDGTTAYRNALSSNDATYGHDVALCSTMGCRYTAYAQHELNLASSRTNYIAYRRQHFTDAQNAYRTQHEAAKSNAAASLRPLLQLQDDGHLETVETSHWRNNQLLGATYTTFGPGLSQPSILYPARQFGLFLAAPAATFTPAAIAGTGISLDARYASTPEATFSFDNGTLVQLLSRTGIVTSYLWGYSNTLPIAKAVGVRYTTLQAAYANAGSDLSALRRVPALGKAGVLLITYTHRPLVGMLSQTDPTGRPTTYEYDALGRLVRTRNEQGNILVQQAYHYAGK